MAITDENRWKGGKGRTKYVYTINDVAELKGKKVGAVRMDIIRGKVRLSDLGSVVRYLSGAGG